MSVSFATERDPGLQYSNHFGARRGRNWLLLGFMYASFYMCRYNFRQAAPFLRTEFNLGVDDISQILSCWFWAYGIGQMINGLLTDRIGGRRAMLIGATGTILANVIFGAASYVGTFGTFALIWLMNGYMQSFGAPAFIKINAAWFSRAERGTFAGVFGYMIQLGLVSINALAPLLLAGFTFFIWTVPSLHWRWLFWVPPMVVAVIAILLGLFVKETPDEAGFPGIVHNETGVAEPATVRVSMAESFRTIFGHPLIWYYAVAYACTGVVRQSSDQLAILYFIDNLSIDAKSPAVVAMLQIMPFVATTGAFASGWVSDRFFKGHRSPVAMFLYFLEAAVIACGAYIVAHNVTSVLISCAFVILIALTANSTHAVVGSAAPMDIGGRKMAGFASGVIDSFQYFGPGIFLPIIGKMIKVYGWKVWFPTMALFGVIGGIAMLMVMRKHGRLKTESIQ